MVALNTPPIIVGYPDKIQGIIADLILNPNKNVFFLEADRQDYTRRACLKAIGKALESYVNQFPSLRDKYPNITRFIALAQTDRPETILERLEDLKDAGRAVDEFISLRRPESNTPTREQLEYWMREKRLDRLERLAALSDEDKRTLRLENLSIEQMQELMARARAWDEVRLGIHQAASEAIINDLPPAARALAIQNEALRSVTDIVAHEATQQLAADVQVGAKFEPSIVMGILERSSPATPVVTATTSGQTTFREGLTSAIHKTPASQEAFQFDRSIQTTAGIDERRATEIRTHFEEAVGRGRDQKTALVESLRKSGVSLKAAERIASANSAVARDYHRLVSDVGTTAEQWRQAVHARQKLARAAAPSARQLVYQIQTATGVSSQKAVQARAIFEDSVRHGRDFQAALDDSLTGLSLSPAKTQAARAALAQAAASYEVLVQQGKTQAAARQFTTQIRAATGVDQAEAIKALATLEHATSQNQPHQTALAESLAELKLEPDQIQATYNALAAATEDYVAATKDLRVQPLSAATTQPVAERFTQQIQTATKVSPEQAGQARIQFEASLNQGKPPDIALTESLQALPLSPQETQVAAQKLTAPARLYEPFVHQDKTQLPVGQASPIASEQFVQRLSSAANISRDQAVQISQHFEQAIRLGQSHQVALLSSLSGLELTPEQLDQISANLTPFAQEYAILVQATPLAQASLAPSPTAVIPLTTIHALNERSLPEKVVITYTALELHQLGIRNDALLLVLAQSSHQADFNPEFIRQTQEALEWLEQHPELLQELGLATPTTPLEHFALEMDSQPRGSNLYARQRFEFLNQQLTARNAQGLSGWLKAPGLKWQTGWAKFAADHAKLVGFAGFVASPKAFVTNKIGGWLAGKGLRWLTKSTAGKALGGLLTKIGGRLAGKGLAKLLGGAVGTLLGGPVGTAVGIALGFVIDKALDPILRALKQVALAMAAFLALMVALIAKLAAVLPALMTGLGLYILPFNPLVGSLMLGGGLLGLAKQVGAWIGKGGIPSLLGNLGTTLSNFLGLSASATVPAYITVAPLVAIGGLTAISIYSSMALTSAFVLPPSGEQPPGLRDEAGNIVEFTCDHPACKVADIVQAYAGGVLTQNTWTASVDTLLRDTLSENAVGELERSVSSFYYLQCVGFKIAVEKELGIDLPHQNAVAFLYNHPNCTEVSKDQAQYGDNAVWGAQSGCPATSPQEANGLCSSNSACCGHIGVITKTEGNQKIYVTSANASGNGSVDTREFTRYNVDKVIRCQ